MDPFALLDQWEALHGWVVERAQGLAPRLARLEEEAWRTMPAAEAQTLAIIAALDLDESNPAFRRRARKLLRALEPSLDGGAAEDALDIEERVDAALRPKLLKSLAWIRDEPPSSWLSSASGPRAALAMARRKAPALGGRRAARWLQSIGYPSAIDDASRRRVLSRLGWLRPRDGDGADAFAFMEGLAHAAQASPTRVDLVLEAFAGGTDASLCLPNDPKCGRCPLASACEYQRHRPKAKAAGERSLAATTRPEDRPREKLLAHGPPRLGDDELLAVLLRSGTREENAVDLARRLLKEAGSLGRLASTSAAELAAKHGVGTAKAACILAALELAARMAREPDDASEGSAANARAVFERLRPRFLNEKREHVVALLLNTKLRVLREVVVSIGTLNRSLVHPREAFKEALKEGAYAVIFAHNHPSGDPKPSRDDDAITQRLVQAGDTLGVRVLDHIVIGRDGYYSYADEGRIDAP